MDYQTALASSEALTTPCPCDTSLITERAGFIKTIYPDLSIAGLADQSSWDSSSDMETWYQSLSDLLQARFGHLGSFTPIFYAGCYEDVYYLAERGYRVEVINRFDGESSPVISATQVRDALISGRSLEGLVHPKIMDDVQRLFKIKWEQFRKR